MQQANASQVVLFHSVQSAVAKQIEAESLISNVISHVDRGVDGEVSAHIDAGWQAGDVDRLTTAINLYLIAIREYEACGWTHKVGEATNRVHAIEAYLPVAQKAQDRLYAQDPMMSKLDMFAEPE